MANIAAERRQHWVQQQLAALPNLRPEHRMFLSVPLTRSRWHLLLDQSPTFPPRGRPAAYAVGPTGVFALHFTESAPSDGELRRLRARIDETFAEVSVGRRHYMSHMIDLVLLMPRAADIATGNRVRTAEVATFHRVLFDASEIRLSGRTPRQVAQAIAGRGFTLISADDLPETGTSATTDELFTETDLRDAERADALRRPFSDWMVFLDSSQRSLVHGSYNGPARFSGPAGTGKSVVALHRMAQFAKTDPGRLLFTTYVRTLPRYHETAFRRLAPDAGDRAEFLGLDAWTRRLLAHRDIPIEPSREGANSAFNRAWQRSARQYLEPIVERPGYWREELERVIKGRGITDFDSYDEIDRKGRERVPLHTARRRLVWEHLYLPYQQYLEAHGIADFTDVTAAALETLLRSPLDQPYELVVVDEVQDFTLLQLKLVHQIAGGRPDAQLLLVGDGQQQVYAGGWRLSDAGIPVVGRGHKLRTNYRNRQAIHGFVVGIEATAAVDDLDGDTGFVLRDSDVVLPGGTALSETFPSSQAAQRLIGAIRACDVPYSGMAVLTMTTAAADRYSRALHRAGIPAMSLEDFDGTPQEKVKIGTVHRAKGLDFAAVFHLTDLPTAPAAELSGADRESAELTARQNLVALTRARDHMWVGFVQRS